MASSTEDLNFEEKSESVIATLREKTSEILRQDNNPELEIDFRRTCSMLENNQIILDLPLMQAYQDYVTAYQKNTSLYNIDDIDDRTNLYVYNTETESKEVKILQNPQFLDNTTCITKLPNNKLFCFGRWDWYFGITIMIDENYEVRMLPSGPACCRSSGIYFNNNIYCFGGFSKSYLSLSMRFDLSENRWIKLKKMPKPDELCSTIILGRNILISGCRNKNLLLYSIDIDSFSNISYNFPNNKRKILINSNRLYLIECKGGSIYESDNEYDWNKIADSTIDLADQVSYSYNKGGIYIGLDECRYFKFDLNEKNWPL